MQYPKALNLVQILYIGWLQGFAFPPDRSHGSNIFGVKTYLLVAIDHAGCGFTTPLYLLSFNKHSSSVSSTLQSNPRSEIGSPKTISPLTLGPKTTQLAHLGSMSKP
jgi:hypothetical protein